MERMRNIVCKDRQVQVLLCNAIRQVAGSQGIKSTSRVFLARFTMPRNCEGRIHYLCCYEEAIVIPWMIC